MHWILTDENDYGHRESMTRIKGKTHGHSKRRPFNKEGEAKLMWRRLVKVKT